MKFRVLSRAAVFLAGAFLALSALPARADQVFNSPMANGASVDNCASWAVDCGWGGAHQFCRTQGYGAARSFQLYNPGRTWVIGSQRFCDGGGCVGFSQVVCMGETNVGGGEQIFNAPQLNGAIVDNCASWATDCGWGGAHQFCRTQGFAAAKSFLLYNPGRTWVIGSQRLCEGGGCVGFAQVICTSAAAPPPPPPPPATGGPLQGQWAWAGGYSNFYNFQQTGNTFTWYQPSTGETAQGTVNGNQLSAEWTNSGGKGSGTGTITEYDAQGRAITIQWSNGVKFARTD
jgi:TM2 domain-containing membrane protein YozV